ncbi:MAG: hypothetical protein ABGY41_08685 [Candidatus Poribacteria bacterium]
MTEPGSASGFTADNQFRKLAVKLPTIDCATKHKAVSAPSVIRSSRCRVFAIGCPSSVEVRGLECRDLIVVKFRIQRRQIFHRLIERANRSIERSKVSLKVIIDIGVVVIAAGIDEENLTPIP